MRFVSLSILIAGSIAFASWHSYSDIVAPGSSLVAMVFHTEPERGDEQGYRVNQTQGVELILDLERYVDPDYGFSVAIPAGWTRIVAAETPVSETDDVLASLEPGYAVGFESPRSGLKDRFADYILIEVLPGDDSGLFEASEEQQQYLPFESEKIAYDRLAIDSATDDATEVDLVIFQRGVNALGYTLGFYAIGEPANEQTMFDAFQIMIRTFTQTSDPFVII